MIERPPAEVFAVLADVASHTEWAGAVRQVRNLHWKDGAVGSTFEQVTSALGRTVVSEVTVTGFEPDKRFAVKAAGPVPAHMVWELAPTPTGTQVRMSLDIQQGSAGGLVVSLLKSRVRKQMEEDLQRLKSRIEHAGSSLRPRGT